MGWPRTTGLVVACVLALAGCADYPRAGTPGGPPIVTPSPSAGAPVQGRDQLPPATAGNDETVHGDTLPPSAGDASVCAGSERWATAKEHAEGRRPEGRVMQPRAAIHATCDRVFDILDTDQPPGYDVSYQPSIVGDASGIPVNVPGEKKLYVVIYSPANSPLPTVRLDGKAVTAVVDADSSEGQSTLGVGTQGLLRFHVTALAATGDTPARLVLDVAHP